MSSLQNSVPDGHDQDSLKVSFTGSPRLVGQNVVKAHLGSTRMRTEGGRALRQRQSTGDPQGQRQQPEAGSERDIRALPFQRTKAMRLSIVYQLQLPKGFSYPALSFFCAFYLFLTNFTDSCPFCEHFSLLVTSQPVVSCEPPTPHTTSLIFLPFTLHPRASVMTE